MCLERLHRLSAKIVALTQKIKKKVTTHFFLKFIFVRMIYIPMFVDVKGKWKKKNKVCEFILTLYSPKIKQAKFDRRRS